MIESRSHETAEPSRSGRPAEPVAADTDVGGATGLRYDAAAAYAGDDAVGAVDAPPVTPLSDGGDSA